MLEWCDSEDDLNQKEKYWISFYNAVEDPNFYNILSGGEGISKGDSLSLETKQKMSLARKGKRYLSDENYQNLSIIQKGNSYAKGHKRSQKIKDE